jgi:hypothetical protein
VFQNPELFRTQVSLSPEQSTLNAVLNQNIGGLILNQIFFFGSNILFTMKYVPVKVGH